MICRVWLFSFLVLGICCRITTVSYKSFDSLILEETTPIYTLTPNYTSTSLSEAYSSSKYFVNLGCFILKVNNESFEYYGENLLFVDNDEKWNATALNRLIFNVTDETKCNVNRGDQNAESYFSGPNSRLVLILYMNENDTYSVDYLSVHLGLADEGTLIAKNVNLEDHTFNLKVFKFENPAPQRGFVAGIQTQNLSSECNLYVFGGHVPSQELPLYSSDVYCCNLNDVAQPNFTWSKSNAEIKPCGRSYSSAVIHQGKLFVFGGRNDLQIFDDVWHYDLEQERWQYDVKSSRTVCIYNTTDNTTTFLKGELNSPTARYGTSTFIVVEPECSEYMVIFGGINASGNYLNELWSYDLNAFRWTQLNYAKNSIFRQGQHTAPPLSFPLAIPINSSTHVLFIGGYYNEHFISTHFVINFDQAQTNSFHNSLISVISGGLFFTILSITLLLPKLCIFIRR